LLEGERYPSIRDHSAGLDALTVAAVTRAPERKGLLAAAGGALKHRQARL
jgi:hypothetical protein